MLLAPSQPTTYRAVTGLLGIVAIGHDDMDGVTIGVQRAHRHSASLVDLGYLVDAVLQHQFEVRLGEARHLRVPRHRVQWGARPR